MRTDQAPDPGKLLYINDYYDRIIQRKGLPPSVTTGEVRSVSDTGGEKGVKPERYDLIPIAPLDHLARVYGKGALKYDDHNWRRGYEWGKSYAALQRHLTAFWEGEDIDEDGEPHLAHAAWHCFTLLEYLSNPRYARFDDRYKESV